MQLFILSVISLVSAISSATDAEIFLTEGIPYYRSKRSSKHVETVHGNLPTHLTPTNYKLRLQPLGQDGEFHTFTGQVQINISCHEATDTIVLHAHSDIQVDLADPMIHSVDQWDKEHTGSSFKKLKDSHHYQRIPPIVPLHSVKVLKLQRDIRNDHCEIKLNEHLKKGMMYGLKLEFSGNLTTVENGPFFQEFYPDDVTREERWYMAVCMSSHKARRVFPCFDEKHFKATFELSVIRPEEMRALATMPLSASESVVHRAGWKIDHFKRTPPMSVNGLTVIIFDPRSLLPLPPRQISGGVTIRGIAHSMVFSKFRPFLAKVTHMVEQLQSYTGISFPLPELHILAIPHVNSYGSSWGVLRFSDKTLSEDFFTSLIPKEIVDQWTEYLITPYPEEHEELMKGLRVYLMYNSLKDIMSIKHIIGSNALFDKLLFYDLGFTNATYRSLSTYKAMLSAMTIRMFNYTLTETTLKKVLHSFMLARSFKTFTTEEFFEALDSQAWLDGILPVAMSTSNIAKSWTEKKHYPVLTVTRNYGNRSATFEQRTFVGEWPHVAAGEMSYSWWIPLTFLTRASLDVNPFMTFGWMKNKKITISYLPRRDIFIIVNPENIGLFMVNYDETNWRLLASYLVESVSGRREPQIPAGTRSKLLYDAIYLAAGGELDFNVALELTLFIKYERDPVVWSTAYDVFDELKGILYDTPVFYKLLIYMRHMIAPAFESLNSEMEADTLLETGYGPLLGKAIAQFHAMLDNNTVHDVPVRTLCSLFRWSKDEWDLGLKRALHLHSAPESNEQSIFLLSRLVACTNNPLNINRILAIVFLDGHHTFTTDEREEIIESISDYPTLLKFISDHWTALETRFKAVPSIWNKIFEEATKDIKTVEGFELVSNLHHTFQKRMGSAQRIVEKSLQTIKENVFSKYKCLSVIDAWLDRQLLTLAIQ